MSVCDDGNKMKYTGNKSPVKSALMMSFIRLSLILCWMEMEKCHFIAPPVFDEIFIISKRNNKIGGEALWIFL